MSTATATRPAGQQHIDGGTFTAVATAPTVDGWSIAITRWTTYRGAVKFEVQRVNPGGTMLRLGLHDSEASARSQANTEWTLDKGV